MFTVGFVGISLILIIVGLYIILTLWSMGIILGSDFTLPQKIFYSIIVIFVPVIGAFVFMTLVRKFITMNDVKAMKESLTEDVTEVFE